MGQFRTNPNGRDETGNYDNNYDTHQDTVHPQKDDPTRTLRGSSTVTSDDPVNTGIPAGTTVDAEGIINL